MSIVFLFLKSWWKEILIVALVGGFLLYWNHLTNTVKEQSTTITQLTDQNKVITDSLETQNQAVAKLKADTDKRLADAKVAIAAAQAKAKINKQRAVDLQGAQPKFPNDLCKSADLLINGELK